MRWTKFISDLPNELILNILSFSFSLSDLQHVRLQSRRFRANADAALKILYRGEASAAAVVDDPTSTAPMMERIAKLRRWEASFCHFSGREIDIHTLGNVNRPGGGIASSDILDLNGGFLLISSPSRTRSRRVSPTGIFYTRLPSLHHMESVVWQRVPFTRDPKEIIKAFRLVAELDLLVIVTLETSPQDTHNLTLHLRTFSTADTHPWASRPIIKWAVGDGVPDFREELLVKLLVVGDHVGLLTWLSSETYSRFLVFDWKSGSQKMFTSVTSPVYMDFCFLSKDVVLLTVPPQNRLDICYVVESSDGPQPASPRLHLLLPKLNEEAHTMLIGIDCNSSPLDNRTKVALANAHPLYLPPFQPSSKNSIIVFNFTYDMSGPSMRAPDCPAFRLVVHRQALLDLMSLSETGTCPHILAWSDWGPVRTRWFAATEDQDTFQQVMSGQRYVSVARKEFADNFPITLYDFNPRNITGSDHAVTSRDRMEYFEPYGDHDTQPFAEEVWSELPYIGKEWLSNYNDMEHAIMDDERIIFFSEIPDDNSDDDYDNFDTEQDVALPGETLLMRVMVMG